MFFSGSFIVIKKGCWEFTNKTIEPFGELLLKSYAEDIDTRLIIWNIVSQTKFRGKELYNNNEMFKVSGGQVILCHKPLLGTFVAAVVSLECFWLPTIIYFMFEIK